MGVRVPLGINKGAPSGTQLSKWFHNEILTLQYDIYRYISYYGDHDYSQGSKILNAKSFSLILLEDTSAHATNGGCDWHYYAIGAGVRVVLFPWFATHQ